MSNIGDVPTIRDLIRAALDDGRSVRQLEQDSDYQVKFQTFQRLSRHPPKLFPKDAKTVAGLAQALSISRTAVVLAYAEGLGIPIEARSAFAMRLPPGTDNLDTELQNALISLIRAATGSSRRAVRVDQSEELTDWGRGIGPREPGKKAGLRRNQKGG